MKNTESPMQLKSVIIYQFTGKISTFEGCPIFQFATRREMGVMHEIRINREREEGELLNPKTNNKRKDIPAIGVLRIFMNMMVVDMRTIFREILQIEKSELPRFKCFHNDKILL